MIKPCTLCGFDVDIDPSDDLPYGATHEQCNNVLWKSDRYKFHFGFLWVYAEDKYPELIKFMLEFGISDFILEDIEEQKKRDKENRFIAS